MSNGIWEVGLDLRRFMGPPEAINRLVIYRLQKRFGQEIVEGVPKLVSQVGAQSLLLSYFFLEGMESFPR